ncbi:MAG TPA: condensation domain-containing protein [Candidatus Acidoferrum sp.]
MNARGKLRTTSSPAATTVGSLGEPLYRFPTSLAQQSFWYLDRLEPGNPCWNIAVRFRMIGPLDLSILERSLNEIIRRHEILRTSFALIEGTLVQIVHAEAMVFLPVDDLSHRPTPARDAEEERVTIAEAALPFDLKTGPLLRTRLLKLAEQDHMLLITVHHIVSDGWSIGIFSDEVAAHYEALSSGNQATAPDLPLQYADYAIWKNEQSESSEGSQHRSYWQTKLADLPACEIPPDHPRPSTKTHCSYILSLVLPVSLTDSLTALARKHGCTLYTLSLAALKMLIAHYTHQDDVYVGTLLAGRDRVELEPLIGVFINTIILRTDLSGDPTFSELLERVQRSVEEGMAHQDLQFQQVVEALRLKRDPNRPTVYSINFIYQRDFVKPLEFAGLSMTPVPSKSPGAIYDLNFFMVQRSDGWRLSCEYDCDMYDAATVNRMIAQLRHLLTEIAANPARKISEYEFPDEAGDPLPAFVPRANLAPPPSNERLSRMGERPNTGGLVVKKILSRVYTHLGKI